MDSGSPERGTQFALDQASASRETTVSGDHFSLKDIQRDFTENRRIGESSEEKSVRACPPKVEHIVDKSETRWGTATVLPPHREEQSELDDSAGQTLCKPSPVQAQCSSNGDGGGTAAASTSGTVRRPVNGFLIFCKRHRAMVRETHPELDNRSVTRVLGDLWSKLGPEKATYTSLAKQNKEAFLKAHPDFKWSGERAQTGTRGARGAKLGNPKQPRDSASSRNTPADHQNTAVGTAILTPAATHSALATQPAESAVKVEGGRGGPSGDQTRHHALLQLAEMCSTEFQTSEASSVATKTSESFTAFSPSKGLSYEIHAGATPQGTSVSPRNHSSDFGPFKKRAKHWGKPADEGGGGGGGVVGAGSEKSHNSIPVVAELDEAGSQTFSIERRLLGRVDEIECEERRGCEEPQPTSQGLQSSLRHSLSYANGRVVGGSADQRLYTHHACEGRDVVGTNWAAESIQHTPKDGGSNPLNLSIPRLPAASQELVRGEGKIFQASESLRGRGERFSGAAASADTLSSLPSTFGETYASVERYKSANHRYRKVSSSATESIPSYSPPPLPVQHATEDPGSYVLPALDATSSNIPGRWYQRGDHVLLSGPSEPDYLLDRKFCPISSAPAREVARPLRRSPTSMSAVRGSGPELGPPTSMVARMMMQPRHEDAVSRADAAGFHAVSELAAPPAATQRQVLPLPVQPDTLSKLLSAELPSHSASVKLSQAPSHGSDFHQWRDPQNSHYKPGAEEPPPASVVPGPATSAPFVARHQLPLAMPTPPAPLVLLGSSRQGNSAEALSLPTTGSRVPVSLAIPGCENSLGASSSLFVPISKPSGPASDVDRQKVPTDVSDSTTAKVDVTKKDGGVSSTALKLQPSTTYGEGKLKKKWAQRMLVEEKMEEDRNKQLLLKGGEGGNKIPSAIDSPTANSRLLPVPKSAVSDAETKAATALPLALPLPNCPTDRLLTRVSHGSSPPGKLDHGRDNGVLSDTAMQMQQAYRPVSQTASGVSTAGSSRVESSAMFSSRDGESIISRALRCGGSSAASNGMTNGKSALPGSKPGSCSITQALSSGPSILSSCLMAKQPLAAVKSSMPTLVAPTRSFNANSHPKLMLQLSQGTTSASPKLESSSVSLGAASALGEQTGPGGRLNPSSYCNSSSGMLLSSPLLSFSSRSSFSPSGSSTLSVVSSSFGLASDTLKVDLGAGGWRAKASPTLSDEKPERPELWKDTIQASYPHPSVLSEVSLQRQTPPDPVTCAQQQPFIEPLVTEGQSSNLKAEKTSNKKRDKTSKKAERAEALKQAGEGSSPAGAPGKASRGKRKKKEAAAAEGEATAVDKKPRKRGRRKVKTEDPALTGPDADARGVKDPAGQAEDFKTQSILSEMRILNPIAACGKKIVDHIVEQLFKSSELSDGSSDASQGNSSAENKLSLNSTNYPSLFSRPENPSKAALQTDNFVVNALVGDGKPKPFSYRSAETVKGDDARTELARAFEKRNGDMHQHTWGQEVKEECQPESCLFGGQPGDLPKLKEEKMYEHEAKLFGDAQGLKKEGKDEEGTNWQPKLFAVGQPDLASRVDAEDSKQKIFGGNGTWMGGVGGRERQLFPACSLVERVVREVCGSPLEKRNCFSCQRKGGLPSFSKASGGMSSSYPLACSTAPRLQGIVADLPKGFPSGGAVQPDHRASVWNTYRQNNDSPIGEELESKPVLVAGSASAVAAATLSSSLSCPRDGLRQYYRQQLKTMDGSVGLNVDKGLYRQGAISVADLIEHHLQQQDEDDDDDSQPPRLQQQKLLQQLDEEEEEQLHSQPLRKSRRANRGQKYQELIKEGFIQPSRDRLARGLSSQEETADLALDHQRKALKRRASERDIQSTPSPLAVSVGGLSRSSSMSSQGGSSKPLASFDLDKEIESLPICSLESVGEKRRRPNSRKDADFYRARRDSRCEDDSRSTSSPQSNNSATTAESEEHRVRLGGGAGGEALALAREKTVEGRVTSGKTRPGEAPPGNATNSTVTGSRKRKARKHCITRISVIGQASSPERGVGKGPSAQANLNKQEIGDASPAANKQNFRSEEVKSSLPAGLASPSAAPILLSPACKDLITPSADKQPKPARQANTPPAAAVTAVTAHQGCTTQPAAAAYVDQKAVAEMKSGSGKVEKAGEFSKESASASSPISGVENNNKFARRVEVTGAAYEKNSSSDKKENCSSSNSKEIKQDAGVKKRSVKSKERRETPALTLPQSETPHVLLPNNSFLAALPQAANVKASAAGKAEGSKPKKASKLRKALLSGQGETNKSSVLDAGNNSKSANKGAAANDGSANNKIASTSKQSAKRPKSDSGKSKSPAAKKSRNGKNSSPTGGKAAPRGKKVKASEANNKGAVNEKLRSVESSVSSSFSSHPPLSLATMPGPKPSLTSSYQHLGQSGVGIPSSLSAEPRGATSISQKTNAARPKSAILSAILASAPMVERPAPRIGGAAYIPAKPLDQYTVPSAPGLKTATNFPSLSGSPKSPGQADTPETGRAIALFGTGSPSETVGTSGQSYTPDRASLRAFAASPNVPLSREQGSSPHIASRLSEGTRGSGQQSTHHALSVREASSKTSHSSLAQGPHTAVAVSTTTTAPQTWQQASPLFMKGASSLASTAAAAAVTSPPQTVLSTQTLPVAVVPSGSAAQ